MSFTIESGKEGASPKRSLFLVTIAAPPASGGFVDIVYLTTMATIGAASVSYNGNTYLARIQKNDLDAIQATGPQGFDTFSGATLTLADADGSLWTNHASVYGWKGSTVTITVVLYDVVTPLFSTNSYTYSFIGGNPQYNHAAGTVTLDLAPSTNFSRLKVPSVPIGYTCPWDFPATAAQRAAALNDPTSIYYQCGYSPDQVGGVGNYASGTTPFTSCDKTRSSPNDPSVGCMARMGNAATTSVAPDGDLTHDIAGHYTARFGGFTFIAPSNWNGKAYVTGQKSFGFNSPNTALTNAYLPWVYGTQWVNGLVLNPCGDPNSLRSEVALCFAPFGPVSVIQLIVNGVLVPYNNSDNLFTWRYNSQPGTPTLTSQGGRSGALSSDTYYSNSSFSGLSDPHGSMCVVEFVVPSELAAPGSVPTVQALVTSGPYLRCFPIATATASGGEITVTFAAGVLNGFPGLGPGSKCLIAGNSWATANGAATVDTATAGPPGTITLLGTSATGSGTGGGAFFVAAPDQTDSGYTVSTQDSVSNGAAAVLPFAAMDLMTWGNLSASQIDAASFYAAAQDSQLSVPYMGADGSIYTHAQYKAGLTLGPQRQPLSSVLLGIRNAGNLIIGANSTTGLVQAFTKKTLADQQTSVITGSNDTTARTSMTALFTGNWTGPASYNTGQIVNYFGTLYQSTINSNTNTPGGTGWSAYTAPVGYYAYTFNETNIEKGSFRITTQKIESTPNTIGISFQDEYNSYQTDSLTETDPDAYAYSGNQEIISPVSVLGAPNFDQCSRIANTQLAEALYGNSRNDAGGTLFFEFTVNQRVLHLTQRLGYICGLTWSLRGIGTGGNPQPVRILSLKPDTDGEHWQVKCAWHNDIWYTYAYGQNPTPYQNTPTLAPANRPPYPWRPGQAVFGSSDALFPGKYGFNLGVTATQYPAQLSISGAVPVTAQPATLPPTVPLQGTTANTGGSIHPGTYSIRFSTNGVNGPVSSVVQVVVPTGTNTNTITVSGIQWRTGAAPSIMAYIGAHSMALAGTTSGYTTASPDSNGNPTSFTFTALPTGGLGLPDTVFNQFLGEEIGIFHGGDWGDAVGTVTGAGLVLNFPAGAWSTNQWQNRILSLYYRPTAATQPEVNISVSSNTANALTMAATGFLAGDVVVMRSQATTHTATTIGDSNYQNSYNGGSGLTVNAEVGNLVMIIAGTGAGQPPLPIASNTSTVLTVNGTFSPVPDATSIFIVISSQIAEDIYTGAIQNTSGSTAQIVATIPAITTTFQSLLVRVATADSAGNTAPMRWQPWREVYIPNQSVAVPVVSVTGTTTLLPQAQAVDADATGGSFTITLPPFSQWIGKSIVITRIDATGNTLTWALTSPDTIPGYGNTGTLTLQGQNAVITATSA